MTPAEAFDKLGFSPIVQAIGGLLWFSIVVGLMMRAEIAKRQVGAIPSAPQPTPMHIPVSTPEYMARVFELLLAANEAQRQTCLKIAAMNNQLIALAESFRVISAARERQIDELIAAVKDGPRRAR